MLKVQIYGLSSRLVPCRHHRGHHTSHTASSAGDESTLPIDGSDRILKWSKETFGRLRFSSDICLRHNLPWCWFCCSVDVKMYLVLFPSFCAVSAVPGRQVLYFFLLLGKIPTFFTSPTT